MQASSSSKQFSFTQKLTKCSQKNNSLLCVGLDPDLDRLPNCLKNAANPILDFNKEIISATKDLVCAYKPNIAFYEAYGRLGLEALEKTLELIPSDIPVILDAKRGDIANTAQMYAKSCFEHYDVDAVTVSPYMGFDSIQPFARYEGKGVIILVKTSNDSSSDLQDLKLTDGSNVYLTLCELIKTWQEKVPAELCAVVGATYPDDLKAVREVLPDCPILLPGVGTQAGNNKLTVQYGRGDKAAPVIINSGRKILYASSDANFAEAALETAINLKEELNSYV